MAEVIVVLRGPATGSPRPRSLSKRLASRMTKLGTLRVGMSSPRPSAQAFAQQGGEIGSSRANWPAAMNRSPAACFGSVMARMRQVGDVAHVHHIEAQAAGGRGPGPRAGCSTTCTELQEKSQLVTGPSTSAGLTVASVVLPSEALIRSQAARSARVLDRA